MRMGVFGAARGLCWRALWAAAVLMGAAAQAHAGAVSLNPLSQTVGLGSAVSIAVMASDVLPDGLGAYNLDLSFRDDVLGFDHVVDGAGLGNAIGLTYALNANVLTLTDTSFDDVATLLALQQPNFTLFTVFFDAIGLGTSDLTLSGVTVADAVGNEVVYATRDASVTVEAANPVPEPGTVPLVVLAGLAGLWVQRRT